MKEQRRYPVQDKSKGDLTKVFEKSLLDKKRLLSRAAPAFHPSPEKYTKHLTDFGEFSNTNNEQGKNLRVFADMVREERGEEDKTSGHSKLYLREVKDMQRVNRLLHLLSNEGPDACGMMLRKICYLLKSRCGLRQIQAEAIVRASLGYMICVLIQGLLSNLLIHITVVGTDGWDAGK